MSQQHTTQASGQGMLERVFKLREHGTTARTEVIAGFTTFLTMVYIVFVNPQILGVAGMDTSAVFVTTCLIAAFGSILMGLFANLPVALAPAMGLNAFFAFVVVQAMGLPWQVGMGAIFWGRCWSFIADYLPRALLDDRQHSGQPARGHHQRHRPVYWHDGAEKRRRDRR
ncbi:xanthine/uracil permease family protein [Salmonella enterica subsp. enterica]|uniref:Xanthine/uracil permease family protein n=1 Tax=Salmonella enterica I TaxID=59201 RepID=A0A379VZW0_SALET|nr:xanthine/uracil permease family protein [Salmonella enterica subsp. enterica]